MNDYIKDYTISKNDDIFIFFDTVNKVAPDSILDIGMFLKRIGAVSRKVRSEGIDPSVHITGIDVFSDLNLPVYGQLYDRILPLADFLEIPYTFRETVFELGILLRPDDYIPEEYLEPIAQYISSNVFYLLVDQDTSRLVESIISPKLIRRLTTENEEFHLYIMR